MRRALLFVLLLAACSTGGSTGGSTGDGGSGAGGDGGSSPERYLPLAVGNSWTYSVTDNGSGTVGIKTHTVEALEDVGGEKAGTLAFRVRTSKPSDRSTVSWQESTPTAVIRHREQGLAVDGSLETEDTFLPGKLRLDESPAHLEEGATWEESYSEHTIDLVAGTDTTAARTERWTVEATAEAVTVPAGTFSCLRIHRVGIPTASDKSYWFALGVGKVKEVGGGQTEELASFTLP